MGLTLKIRSLKSIGDEIGVSEEEVKGICRNLNLPIEKRGSIEMVDTEMFEKHFNSGKPRRKLSKKHLEDMKLGRRLKDLEEMSDRNTQSDRDWETSLCLPFQYFLFFQ